MSKLQEDSKKLRKELDSKPKTQENEELRLIILAASIIDINNQIQEADPAKKARTQAQSQELRREIDQKQPGLGQKDPKEILNWAQNKLISTKIKPTPPQKQLASGKEIDFGEVSL